MSEMLDLLLGAGAGLVDVPREEYEIKRLTDKIGQPFLVRAHALTMREFDSLPRGEDWKIHIILAAVDDPDLRSAQLGAALKHDSGRKAPLTPVEVVNALLLPGEVTNLSNAIMELSGFNDEAVEKIRKN